jgi:hypothetical protein
MFANEISNIARFWRRTENPRVGGFNSTPWPPFKSIIEIKKLHRGARNLRPILALVSNISVRCSLDQYGSHAAGPVMRLIVTATRTFARQRHTSVNRIVLSSSLYNIAIDRRNV